MNTAIQEVPVTKLQPNPWNRQIFNPDALQELTQSIKETGVLEPLIVRPSHDGFEIASGHRRWLAAKEAGLSEVPCIVKPVDDMEVQDINLIANIQREEISALDKARMVKQRMDAGNLTPDQMASHLGKSEVWVSTLLGFLDLPGDAQAHLAEAGVGYRPMRAIASLPNTAYQQQVAKEVKEGKLKPAEIEHRVRQLQTGFRVSMAHRAKHGKSGRDGEAEMGGGGDVVNGEAEKGRGGETAVQERAPEITESPGVEASTEKAPVKETLKSAGWELANQVKETLAGEYIGNYSPLRLKLRSWLDKAWESRSVPKLAAWGVAAGLLLGLIHPAVRFLTGWIH